MHVSLTEYQISKVCPELMYIQHRHVVCGKLHICHDLVLDENVNDNAYPTPLLHEALDVDHKIVILGIGWYHNTFSHLCVQHQYYSEHDTLYLSICFNGYFPILPRPMTPCLRCSLDRCLWNCLDRLT